MSSDPLIVRLPSTVIWRSCALPGVIKGKIFSGTANWEPSRLEVEAAGWEPVLTCRSPSVIVPFSLANVPFLQPQQPPHLQRSQFCPAIDAAKCHSKICHSDRNRKCWSRYHGSYALKHLCRHWSWQVPRRGATFCFFYSTWHSTSVANTGRIRLKHHRPKALPLCTWRHSAPVTFPQLARLHLDAFAAQSSHHCWPGTWTWEGINGTTQSLWLVGATYKNMTRWMLNVGVPGSRSRPAKFSLWQIATQERWTVLIDSHLNALNEKGHEAGLQFWQAISAPSLPWRLLLPSANSFYCQGKAQNTL